MENHPEIDFIIIDDDSLNNYICSRYLKLVFPKSEIRAFTDPALGLEYIQQNYALREIKNTVLFLDINMPVLNGWEVLSNFAEFSDHIKNQFKIFIVSSSIAIEDRQRVNRIPLVADFIEKPFSEEQLRGLAEVFTRPG